MIKGHCVYDIIIKFYIYEKSICVVAKKISVSDTLKYHYIKHRSNEDALVVTVDEKIHNSLEHLGDLYIMTPVCFISKISSKTIGQYKYIEHSREINREIKYDFSNFEITMTHKNLEITYMSQFSSEMLEDKINSCISSIYERFCCFRKTKKKTPIFLNTINSFLNKQSCKTDGRYQIDIHSILGVSNEGELNMSIRELIKNILTYFDGVHDSNPVFENHNCFEIQINNICDTCTHYAIEKIDECKSVRLLTYLANDKNTGADDVKEGLRNIYKKYVVKCSKFNKCAERFIKGENDLNKYANVCGFIVFLEYFISHPKVNAKNPGLKFESRADYNTLANGEFADNEEKMKTHFLGGYYNMIDFNHELFSDIEELKMNAGKRNFMTCEKDGELNILERVFKKLEILSNSID